MNELIDVRPITEADAPGFREAIDAVSRERQFMRRFEGPPLESAAAFVRSNIERGNPQFVAVSGTLVVGWCDIVRNNYESERHCGELGMGIIAPCRGKGIGTRLMAATIAAGEAAGLLRIELSVNADNHAAIALYRRFGFVEEGRQRRASLKERGYVDVLLMARLQSDENWPAPTA